MPISRFRGEYFFLSNFFPCREGVLYDGDIYPTSEHAYQAAKVEEREGRESFTCGGSLGDNPMDAKAKGGKVKVRPCWDRIKVEVMLEVVRSKFARDVSLQKKLLATQSQHIVEGHTGDKFWGGKSNHLGNILMRVREELRATQGALAEAAPAGTADEEQEKPDVACCKPKQRSKGNSDRLAYFQDQLKVWADSDSLAGTDRAKAPVEGVDEPHSFTDLLPSAFVDWLRTTLVREVSVGSVESLVCSVEVILSGSLEDPSEDPSVALIAVSDLLAAEGAQRTAAELEVHWAVHAASAQPPLEA